MAEENNEAQGHQQPVEPAPDLRALDRLVGTWELSGDVAGTVTYEWMEGGFFLLQRVDLGPEAKGLEVIGHESGPGAGAQRGHKEPLLRQHRRHPRLRLRARGDTLTIWFGEKGSPAYYGAIRARTASTLTGAWHYPGGGGYEAISTRVG